MNIRRLIFNPYLIVAALFILAVSVAPAMAAEANSRHMSSLSAGSAGQGSPFSKAGGEKHTLTRKNTAEISAGSQVTNLGAKSGTDDPVKNVDKPKKKPWWKKWWIWVIVAVVVVVIIATAGAAGAFAGGGAGGVAGGAGSAAVVAGGAFEVVENLAYDAAWAHPPQ
jgi:hypothetical protein